MIIINGKIFGKGIRGEIKHNHYTQSQKEKMAHELKPITKEEALEDYEKLRKVKPEEPTLSRIGNKFVDYYTFTERLNTIGRRHINFYDLFENRTDYEKKNYTINLINYLKDRPNSPKLIMCWYKIFSLYFGSIQIFKPLIAMSIYKKFKPKSVLDFTMGWGGRLVGACALDIPHYIGIDLNERLKKPYEDMVRDIKPHTQTKITLMFKNALNVDYSKLDYDMVLTSPPYYNIEIYNGTKSKEKEEWDNEFYNPIFEKTFKYLKNGGYYCLNVPEEVYERVCIPILGKAHILFPLPKVKRTADEKYKEFIYIWKK
jgi:hypothetical protein